MRKFYENIEQKKEQELLADMQNRKHHDTLLPTQKSPIPLNRYEEFGGDSSISGQVITPQSTLNRSQQGNYKMIARALYNFQVRKYFHMGYAIKIQPCPLHNIKCHQSGFIQFEIMHILFDMRGTALIL